jgi:hypothetical protein
MTPILMPVVVRNDRDCAHRGSGSRLTVGQPSASILSRVPTCRLTITNLPQRARKSGNAGRLGLPAQRTAADPDAC